MSIFLLDSPAGYVSLEAVTKNDADEDDEDEIVPISRITGNHRHGSEKISRDQDRRVRREIANSNERRRMQNINAGFASLRSLLPIQEPDKMSKAHVLQHATEYICELEQDKERLANQLIMLKKMIGASYDETPNNKRIKLEGVEDLYDQSLINAMTNNDLDAGSSKPITGAARRIIDDLRKRIVELRTQYDKERRLRLSAEEDKRAIESQLYDGQRLSIPLTNENGESLELTYQVVDSMHGRETLEVSAEDESLSAPITISIPSPQVGDSDTAASIATKFLLNTDKINGSLLEAAILSDKVDVELTSMPTASCSNRMRDHMYAGTRPSIQYTNDRRRSPGLRAMQRSSVCYDVVDSPSSSLDRSYLAEASRQNLETIVEAIRHLEGDHLFDSVSTKKSILQRGMYQFEPSEIEENSGHELPSTGDETMLDSEPQEALLSPGPSDGFSFAREEEEEPINLEFRPSSPSTTSVRRPGVIVVKPLM